MVPVRRSRRSVKSGLYWTVRRSSGRPLYPVRRSNGRTSYPVRRSKGSVFLNPARRSRPRADNCVSFLVRATPEPLSGSNVEPR